MFIAVGTPSRRGDGYADLSYVYAAAEEIAGLLDGFTVVVTKSTVPVGTGDEIEAIIKRVRPDADVRRGLQPGVPARGRGDRGLQAPRPRGGGHRRRARPGGDARALPAALPQRDADPVHQPAHHRADQIRRQRLPGAEDHLHQRDGRPVRGGRRRRAAGGARHRPGQADRRQVPERRPRLRRLLLPEGHPGPGPHRPRRRHAGASWSRPRSKVNDARKTGHGRARWSRRWAATWRARRSASWA